MPTPTRGTHETAAVTEQPTVRMVTPGLHVEADAATQAAKEIAAFAERWTAFFRGTYAAEEWPEVNAKGLGPDTVTFCRTMAGVQEGHGPSLGQPTPTSSGIRTRLQVAEAIEPAMQSMSALVSAMRDVWAVNLSTANRGARDIYNRAVVVAESNHAVELAIDPIRTARTRIAKKAAFTRRRKAETKDKPEE